MHAIECFNGNFIGADYGLNLDLKPYLDEGCLDLNYKLILVNI